ncbi:MAG: MATE family efflux transporter, partial [Micropruina sp.]|uniref:MATE family efflux transporter n=1 Tax=Micropruina sp. TaxID=2737536 RepID=UPI0039E4C7E8
GDAAGAARAAERPVPIAVAVSLAFILGLVVVADPLTAVVGGTAIDAGLSGAMLRVVVFSLPFAGLAAIARGFVTGRGSTRPVVLSAVVAAVVDVGVSVALLPVLGPLGVSVGTVCSPLAGCAVLLVWIARLGAGATTPRLLPACLRPPGRAQREPFGLGWSDGLLGATSAGAGVVATLVLSTSPPEVLAATRTLDALLVIAWVVLMGITSAGLTVLSQGRGANDRDAYRRALTAMLVVGAVPVIVLTAGFPWVTEPLLAATVGTAIAAQAGSVAWLAWTGAPWILATSAALAICRSFRDTRTPLWASLLSEYAVFLPVGWLLCRGLGLGIVGLFVTHHVYYAAFLLVSGGVAVAHLRRPWDRPSRYEAAAESGR